MEATETAEYKRYKIEIHRDDDCDGPREWDNICIFHIGHSRYSFGDVNHSTKEDMDIAEAKAKAQGDIVVPLYMYDHSGITISLSPFQCRWDSGQVGFVVIPRLKMIEEFGKKNFTPKLKIRALEVIEGEVKTLDRFLTNQVYGYKIFGPMAGDKDDDDCREELDACWGFYGEPMEIIKECEGTIDYMIAAPKRERDKYSSLYL